jgi:hypothetical protein
MLVTMLVLVPALALLVCCNPLDPDEIDPDADSGTTTPSGCQPACGADQYCLQAAAGGCGCFAKCDDNLCTNAGYPGYSCVYDHTTGYEDCYDLSQLICQ